MEITREGMEILRSKIRELNGVAVTQDNRPKGCAVGDMLNDVFGKIKEREVEIMREPTGKYKNCKHWPEVVEAAKLRPHLYATAKMYELTGHPGCLNVIMDNADADLWTTYYTGK